MPLHQGRPAFAGSLSLHLKPFCKFLAADFFAGLFFKIFLHLLIVALIFDPVVALASSGHLPIAADGSTNTQVTQTASGIDQINIAAPDSGGLSHNRFRDYNINESGQVINNFSGSNANVAEAVGVSAATSTQIGGLVLANPNLVNAGGSEARIILNEVTSSRNSQLLGYAEIAGGKAELIIANPNGITCAGCGFINTSNLSLIAGSSNFESGTNSKFALTSISRGVAPSGVAGFLDPSSVIPLITISGLGLDARNTSYTDIISSSIKLVGGIYGSGNTVVSLKTGDESFNYATKNVTSKESATSTQETQRAVKDLSPLTGGREFFAIDAESSGSVNAGRIFLIATQEGVGVNLGGKVVASLSDLNIDTKGNVYYSTLGSLNSSVNIKTDSLGGLIGKDSNSLIQASNSGLSGNVNLDVSGEISNGGYIIGDAVSALASTSSSSSFGINNSSNSLNNSGIIKSSVSIKLSFVGDAINSGNIISNSDLVLSSSLGSIYNSGNIATKSANLTLNANLGSIVNSDLGSIGLFLVKNSDDSVTEFLAQNLILNLKDLKNSAIINADSVTLISSGVVANSNKILASDRLSIAADSINNSNWILSDGDLTIDAANLNNSNSNSVIRSIQSSLNLNISNQIYNSGELSASLDTKISSSNILNNSGKIFFNNSASLNVSDFVNSSLISSQSALTINIENSIANQASGLIFANGNLSINSSSNDNFTNYGHLFSNQNLTIDSKGADLVNASSGQIKSVNNLTLSSKNFTNNNLVQSGSDLAIRSSFDFKNTANILSGSAGNLDIAAGGGFANSQKIFSGNNLDIKSSDSLINFGVIAATHDINIVASTAILHNSKSGIITAENLALNLENLTNDSAATIYSQGSLNLGVSNKITNSTSGLISGKSLSIANSGSLTNSGQIQSIADLNFNLTGDLTNSIEGTIISVASSNITANNIANSGQITAGKDLEIAASSSITNNNLLHSANKLSINTDNLVNNTTNSLILAGNDLGISASSVDNSNTNKSTNAVAASEVMASRAATNGASVQNSSTQSSISSGIASASGKASIVTNLLNNDGGVVRGNIVSYSWANKNSAVSLSNISGIFFASTSIDLNLGSSDYTITGSVFATNHIDIAASNITNLGSVTTNSYINLNAASGSITNGIQGEDNSNIQLVAGSYLNATASGFVKNYATISATTDLTLTSATSSVDNYGSIIGGSGATNINAASATGGNFNNYNNNSILTAANNLTFNLGNNLNNNGEISVANDLTANVGSNLNNNATALIWSNHDTTLNVANALTNTKATIYSDNNLTIQKNSSSDSSANKSTLVRNSSGNIETYSGDIFIKAATFINERTSDNLKIIVDTSYLDIPQKFYEHGEHTSPNINSGQWASDCGSTCTTAIRLDKSGLSYYANFGYNITDHDSYSSSYVEKSITTKRIEDTSNIKSTITSGKNLTIESNNFTNDSSSIGAAKNINIAAINFTNNSHPVTDTTRHTCRAHSGTCDVYALNPADGETGFSSVGGYKYKFIKTLRQFEYYEFEAASSYMTASIKSGGAMTITQNGTSKPSLINGNISQNNASFDAINRMSKNTSFNSVNISQLIATGEIDVNLSGILNALSSYSSSKSALLNQINGATDSTSSASQSSTLLTRSIKNGGSENATNNQLVSDPLTKLSSKDIKNPNSSSTSDSSTDSVPDSSTSSTTIPLGSFKINTDTTNNAPLVESRSQFTDLTKFYGSSYFFAQMGINENDFLTAQTVSTGQNARMLGDSFVETKLLSDQLLSLRKDALLLDSETDTNKEIKFLIDNAISQKTALNLNAGQALTKDQANSLSKDIIWFESSNINGQLVFVPKIYLSLASRNALLGTSLTKSDLSKLTTLNGDLSSIAAISLKSKSSGSLATNAVIFSNADLIINAPSTELINRGSIIGNENLTLSLDKLSNKSISLATDINNSISGRAEIKAGNNLSVITVNEITNTEADIASLNNLNLTATAGNIGNISLGKITAINDLKINASNIKNYLSNISSGNSATIIAASDLKNIGGNIEASNNLSLVSTSGNILNTALVQTNDANLIASKSDSYQTQFGGSANTSGNINSSLIQTANLIGGSINIAAAKDFENLAANITTNKNTVTDFATGTSSVTSGDLSLATGRDVNIGVLQIHNRSEQHWGNKKNGGDIINDKVQNLQSQFNIAGNLDSISGNDTVLQAAKINAGTSEDNSSGNINIAANNNLLLLAATDSSFASSSIRRNSTFAFKNNDKGRIDTTILNNQITSNGGEARADLNSGNVTYAQYKAGSLEQASSTNIGGGNSNYEPSLSYLKNLDPSKTIYNPLDEIHKSWDQTSRGLNQTGTIVVALAATAATGGALGFGVVGAVAASAASTAAVSATNASMNDSGNFFRSLDDVGKITLKDTTSRKSLENMAIAGVTAGVTASVSKATGLNDGVSASASTAERVGANMANAIARVEIATASQLTATSLIKGESLSQSIKNAGGANGVLTNMAAMVVGEVGAREIGFAAHNNKISQPTQLALHAGLGCALSAGMGGGCASGAAAGAIGEFAASTALNNRMTTQSAILIGQTAGSAAALLTSELQSKSDEQIAKNTQVGGFVGNNAAVNNAIYRQVHEVTIGSNLSKKIGLKKLEKDINTIEEWLGLDASAKASDLDIKTGNYHTSLLIVPENQEMWKSDPRFIDNLTADGKVYATIGGGPDQGLSELISGDLPNLHGGINRPYDVDLSTKILTTQISPSSVGNEDAMIKKLITLNNNYESNLKNSDNGLKYWFFPTKDNQYFNSNSYISGLTQAAELNIDIKTNLKAPGYDKPVPPPYFY